MSLFPQLGPGIITQLPYLASQSYLTEKAESPSGYRKTYAWRNSPLGRWNLNYSNITPAELAVLEAFIDDRDGPLKEFIFLDPAGNQLPDGDISTGSWTRNALTAGSLAQADPFGGTDAQLLTSSGDGYAFSTCFIDNVNGWSASGIVWLKLLTATTLNVLVGIYSQVNSFTVAVRLTTGVWKRVDVSGLISDTVSIGQPAVFQIGGASSIPSGSQVVAYAPRVSTMGLCDGVAKSPQNYGRHPYCRFEEDARVVTYPISPGSRQLQLMVQEIHR